MDYMIADLSNAFLIGACLVGANLSNANLAGADLIGAELVGVNFRAANLGRANLCSAILDLADLRCANLSEAMLEKASLIRTNLAQANLTGCRVHGVSAWNTQLDGAIQSNLIITDSHEPTITVDNLEVAQFVYLLLHNPKIRDVIDSIAKKVVLILGRFTPERQIVLDSLREELRNHDYLPVLFDFEKPTRRNLTETISTLAHMSRFIIADLTDARSIPQELERIVPRLRVPVQSLLHEAETEAYAMYRDFEDYHWVLPLYRYSDVPMLLLSLKEKVIHIAEEKAKELEKKK
jgi:hypothetical protein